MRSSLLRIKAKLGLGVGIDIGEFWAAMGVAHHLFPYDGVLGSSSGTPDPKGCPRGGGMWAPETVPIAFGPIKSHGHLVSSIFTCPRDTPMNLTPASAEGNTLCVPVIMMISGGKTLQGLWLFLPPSPLKVAPRETRYLLVGVQKLWQHGLVKKQRGWLDDEEVV